MVIGLGIDLVDIGRVVTMLERDAERLAKRVLTTREWEYCSRMQHPAPHVAVRLAAKEAAFKALAGTDEARAIGWREIEVVHDDHRRPMLELSGRAEARMAEMGGRRLRVSLTHSQTAAAAVVIVEGEDR